ITEKSEHAFTNKKPKRKIRKSPDDPPTSLPLAPPLVPPPKLEFETHGIQQTAFAASDKVEGGIDNRELARQFSKAKESASASGKLNGLEKKGRRAPKNGTSPLESGGSEVSGSHVSTRAPSTTG